jgi:acyl carrier protein
MPSSETDLHAIFAEAIVAGRPTSSQHPEIMTGLERVGSSRDDRKPTWYGNPRFSHHISEKETDQEDNQEARREAIPVKRQLSDAKTEAEAFKTLVKAFSSKLEAVLQLPPDSVDTNLSLVKLGVDSLVAVEIRSWFVKEIHVDMPVLKVLSDASAADRKTILRAPCDKIG